MKFKMPVAKRERLEELLEYLGKTENYSEYYKGNRAEDFKGFIDIESPWAWEYADLMLRGLERRSLVYGEVHHIVTKFYYKSIWVTGAAMSNKLMIGNCSCLTYFEHLYAHYALAQCCIEKYNHAGALAFNYMYTNAFKGKKKAKRDGISKEELLSLIPEIEARRISSKRNDVRLVDEEGRTHTWEDPLRAKRESASAAYWRNPEKIREKQRNAAKKLYDTDPEYRENKKAKSRDYCHKNPEKNADRNKKYYEEHADELRAQAREYGAAHKEEKRIYNKKYRAEHPDELKAKNKALRERRGDFYNANRRAKRANDKEYRERDNAKRRERRKNDPEWRKHDLEVRRANYARKHPNMIIRAHYSSPEEARKMHNKKGLENYHRKIDAGFRRLKNPITGKREWVFVGLPEAKEVAA